MFVTRCACVSFWWLLSSVVCAGLMIFQTGGRGQPFVADFADVMLFHASMLRQTGGFLKPLLTEVAYIAFAHIALLLFGVFAFMSLQTAG